MAAALMGRDSWRYSNVVVIIGAVAIVFGAVLNRVYLRELMTFRGPARRAETGDDPPPPPPASTPTRIR